MNKFYKSLLALGLLIPMLSFGGNPDRSGQAGAAQLLINPWARTTGFSGLNVACVSGLEAERLNIAGMAFTKSTEVVFTRTTWLSGADIFINSAGIAQRLNESSVIGLSVMAFDFGDNVRTTDVSPDGDLGLYSPVFMNLGLSYAREFSNRIYGGFVLRLVSEGTDEVKASGVAIDAGIQYVTGKRDQVRFGISLKNVGTPMRFSGNGLSTQGSATADQDPITLTLSQRSERFELPSLMNIGASYDFELGALHRLTGVANFTSNSFTKDQFGLGFEYGFKENFMLRAGYNYEKDLLDDNLRTNISSGFAAGTSIAVDLGEKALLGIDYSYRPTKTFDGNHVIGLRLAMK